MYANVQVNSCIPIKPLPKLFLMIYCLKHIANQYLSQVRGPVVIYFAGALLLGSVILLAVVIRVFVPNNNRWSTRFYTADFSMITCEKKEQVTPFERGESRDHTCEKRFSFGCKIVKCQPKQVDQKNFPLLLG
jgi:hypothetical protein